MTPPGPLRFILRRSETLAGDLLKTEVGPVHEAVTQKAILILLSALVWKLG